MADTTVKFIHSGMANSPVLSGQAGGLIGVLDACLVTGFGLVSVTSLVISGGVATCTVAAGHSFEPDTVMLLAGAVTTGGDVNGEQKVVATATNTFTFATTLADQTATGTITAKVAPLGWSNSDVAPGTNIKAYRATDVAGTRFFLRVDDTGTREARWQGYETMSDINTGTNPWGTSTSGGGYATKSDTADSSSREWTLIGDGKRFYFVFRPGAASTAGRWTLMFGDFISRKSPDAYRAYMSALPSSGISGVIFGNTASVSYCGVASGTNNGYVTRGVSGLGSSVAVRRFVAIPSTADTQSGSTGAPIIYPNTANNELLLNEIFLVEGSNPNMVVRGKLSGVYFCPHAIGALEFANRQSLTGVESLPNKTLKAIVGGSNGNTDGPLFFDVTGPWE